jgi:hypothetical protein
MLPGHQRLTTKTNRILFDTNVWNYFAEHSSAAILKKEIRERASKILVAPSTLYEALRVKDAGSRARRAALITDPAWTRLMPEAYSESQELLAEIKRLRPQWLNPKGDRGVSQRFRHDWRRTKAGFWQRVRQNPDREANFIAQLGGPDLDIARSHAYAQRQLFVDANWKPSTPLTDVVAQLLDCAPGYGGDKIPAWRINAWTSTTAALEKPGHPYLDWLSGDLDFRQLGSDPASWLKFWFYEVQSVRMPRFWLRWAFEHLQLFHKVTDGTPGDAQLGTYLLEADVIVSADKNFLLITEAVRPYAEVTIAKTKRLAADEKGVLQTLEFLQAL